MKLILILDKLSCQDVFYKKFCLDKNNRMERLIDALNDVFNRLKAADKKLTYYKVALEVCLDPSLLGKALEGKRSFSDVILEKLATSPHIPYTYEEMRLMRAREEYPELQKAIDIMMSSTDEGLDQIRQALIENPFEFPLVKSQITSYLASLPQDILMQALKERFNTPESRKSLIEDIKRELRDKNV